MKAKKLKIQVKTSKFSIPLPALRFSTVRWVSKLIFKYCPSKVVAGAHKSSENEIIESILKNVTYEDIEQFINQLEQEQPFEIVDINTYDEKEGRVAVKIYTI
ncbi:hypothetical protein [Methanobacterium aggregans]|uniref:hypothetical protein n=1 Tax=Methanobacterium aggregans TaxID=1615586 RepID=UPI001AE389EA|nr:hypothetical protein [Methanobacterium aggregans]MBP2045942.1 hypothetical protein [Methanobacterium aggregans]